MSTTSGSSTMIGKPGTRARHSPTTTRAIGFCRPYLRDSADTATTTTVSTTATTRAFTYQSLWRGQPQDAYVTGHRAQRGTEGYASPLSGALSPSLTGRKVRLLSHIPGNMRTDA